jgi:hypothetical protein
MKQKKSVVRDEQTRNKKQTKKQKTPGSIEFQS